MKTPEQIEKLAEKKYLSQMKFINDSSIKGFVISARKFGFIEGYIECQEDMQKLMDDYQNWIFTTTEPLKSFKQWLDNSLNKQD